MLKEIGLSGAKWASPGWPIPGCRRCNPGTMSRWWPFSQGDHLCRGTARRPLDTYPVVDVHYSRLTGSDFVLKMLENTKNNISRKKLGRYGNIQISGGSSPAI